VRSLCSPRIRGVTAPATPAPRFAAAGDAAATRRRRSGTENKSSTPPSASKTIASRRNHSDAPRTLGRDIRWPYAKHACDERHNQGVFGRTAVERCATASASNDHDRDRDAAAAAHSRFDHARASAPTAAGAGRRVRGRLSRGSIRDDGSHNIGSPEHADGAVHPPFPRGTVRQGWEGVRQKADAIVPE